MNMITRNSFALNQGFVVDRAPDWAADALGFLDQITGDWWL